MRKTTSLILPKWTASLLRTSKPAALTVSGRASFLWSVLKPSPLAFPERTIFLFRTSKTASLTVSGGTTLRIPIGETSSLAILDGRFS